MVSLRRIAIPLFYNSDRDKGLSFNLRQRREAFINIDTRRFKIQTSDMGPPPPPHPLRQGLVKRLSKSRQPTPRKYLHTNVLCW